MTAQAFNAHNLIQTLANPHLLLSSMFLSLHKSTALTLGSSTLELI